MDIRWREPDDWQRLHEAISREKQAMQRDRLRAVVLAVEGKQALEIAEILGRSRRFVQAWVYAYRDGGIAALRPGKSSGRPTKLPREQEAAFKQRMLDGPRAGDGVCTLRGVDAQRILAAEFGVPYTLDGVYDLLHRLGLSCLSPRPRHRKNDPQAMRAWVDSAPLLSSRSESNTLSRAWRYGCRMKHASASRAR